MAGQHLCNDVKKPFVVVRWKIKAENCIFTGSTILIYKFQKIKFSDDCKPRKLKSSVEGMVLNLLVQEGDIVQPGAPILEFGSCSHEIVLKGICATCGKNLGWTFPISQGCDLTLTDTQAQSLMKAGEDKLLKKRKLALLICVDQILIDIKNDGNEDKIEVKNTTPRPTCALTIFPGAKEFLKSISEQYDLHFFTHCSVLQSKEIACLLNKICRIFPKRVWTANEFDNVESNENKLKIVFPHGDSMVCVVDCHENMWNMVPNAVYVKPYDYLAMVENDIRNDVSKSQVEEHKIIDVEVSQSKDQVSESNSECKSVTTEQQSDIQSTVKTSVSDTTDKYKPILDSSKLGTGLHSAAKVSGKNENILFYFTNMSDYFAYLKTILQNIHKGYYRLFDEMVREHMFVIHQQVIPDLKNVIPYIKRNILLGARIVFSGVIPTNVEAHTCPYWILAESLGAHVSHDLILDNKVNKTTHVIAAKEGTTKFLTAKSNEDVHIVSVEWLYDCAFRWDHVSERKFSLVSGIAAKEQTTMHSQEKTSDDQVKSLLTLNSQSAQSCSNIVEDENSLSNLSLNACVPNQNLNITSHASLHLTSEELDSMNREVENEILLSDEDSRPCVNDDKSSWQGGDLNDIYENCAATSNCEASISKRKWADDSIDSTDEFEERSCSFTTGWFGKIKKLDKILKNDLDLPDVAHTRMDCASDDEKSDHTFPSTEYSCDDEDDDKSFQSMDDFICSEDENSIF